MVMTSGEYSGRGLWMRMRMRTKEDDEDNTQGHNLCSGYEDLVVTRDSADD